MKKIKTSLFATLTLALAAAPAFAGPVTTTYNDRTAWETAAGAVSTINFEGIAPTDPGYQLIAQPSGLATGGVTFTAESSDMFVIDPGYDPEYNWGSGAILDAQSGVNAVLATFDQPVFAFGLDLMSSFSAESVDFLVTLSNGEQFTVTTSVNPNRTFWGVTSEDAIAWASFAPQTVDALADLDNFSVGAGVPEPASIGLALVGVSGLLAVRRRRRKA